MSSFAAVLFLSHTPSVQYTWIYCVPRAGLIIAEELRQKMGKSAGTMRKFQKWIEEVLLGKEVYQSTLQIFTGVGRREQVKYGSR